MKTKMLAVVGLGLGSAVLAQAQNVTLTTLTTDVTNAVTSASTVFYTVAGLAVAALGVRLLLKYARKA